ncbi:RNA-binding S4 domain-containing protein [soil metagenome]
MKEPINASATATVRLDQWLWAARFYKTRALAKQAIESGRVELGGQGVKPSRGVKVADALMIQRGDERFDVSVLGLSEKRGSATMAQTLYLESTESIAARAALREKRRMEATGYRAPQGKPDKRARRLIQALGDLDSF